MERWKELIGLESPLHEVNAALREYARSTDAPVVGAHVVTCSDEAEHKSAATFQSEVVNHALPALKPGLRAAFRTANLGARYEWGALRVAEHHYATPATEVAFKLLVVKINAHVGVSTGPQGPQYGPLQRYGTRSTACGALHALLQGDTLPALSELRETFRLDGRDRIAALNDTTAVDLDHRFLFAAIVNARLQARRAFEDILEHAPHSPTLYVVLPCVTLNRAVGPDTELVCGSYRVDRRPGGTAREYIGLGDDPAGYRVESLARPLRVAQAT